MSRTACAFVGSGRPGTAETASGRCQTSTTPRSGACAAGVVRRVACSHADALRTCLEQFAVADHDQARREGDRRHGARRASRKAPGRCRRARRSSPRCRVPSTQSVSQRFDRQRVAEEVHLHAVGNADHRLAVAVDVDARLRACRAASTACRRPTPARSASRAGSRRCAGRPGRAAARGPRDRTPGTGRAPPCSAAPADPDNASRLLRSNQPPGGSAISTSPPSCTIGATSSASPHMNCVSYRRTSGLRGKRERHRAHDRQAGSRRDADRLLEIRNQPVAEREPLARDRLGLGAERPRLALADAVHANVRAEHRRLQPADEQLRARLLGAVEAADVRAVIRVAAHAPRKTAADRRGQAFPVALRIAAPAERIALLPDHAARLHTIGAPFFGRANLRVAS